jgi:hypothetical protein
MLGHSIVSQYFMEPEGSIPNSQQLSTCSYPEPDHMKDKYIVVCCSYAGSNYFYIIKILYII